LSSTHDWISFQYKEFRGTRGLHRHKLRENKIRLWPNTTHISFPFDQLSKAITPIRNLVGNRRTISVQCLETVTDRILAILANQRGDPESRVKDLLEPAT
jgi:hypothetical protein